MAEHPQQVREFVLEFLREFGGLVFRDRHGQLLIERKSSGRDMRGHLDPPDADTLRQRWRDIGRPGTRPPAEAVLDALRQLTCTGDRSGVTEARLVLRTPCLGGGSKPLSRGPGGDELFGFEPESGTYVVRLSGRGGRGKGRAELESLLASMPGGGGSRTTLVGLLLSSMHLPRIREGEEGLPPLLIEAPPGEGRAAVRLGLAVGWLVDEQLPEVRGPAEVRSTLEMPDDDPRRVALFDLGADGGLLDELVREGLLAEARRRRPDGLRIFTCCPAPEFGSAALLSTAIVQVAASGGDDPVDLAREHRSAILAGLVGKADDRWHKKGALPFDPAGWAGDWGDLNLSAGGECLSSRWTGRQEQRDRMELFWLGSLRPGDPLAPGAWTRQAESSGLLRQPVFQRAARLEPEAVDRMRELLERHVGSRELGRNGLFELRHLDGSRYSFERTESEDDLPEDPFA